MLFLRERYLGMKHKWWLGICAALLAISLLGSGVWLFLDNRQFKNEAVERHATVISVRQHRLGDETKYYARVRFSTPKGKVRENEIEVSRFSKWYSEGFKGFLLYRESDGRFERKGAWNIFAGYSVLVVWVLISGSIAVYYLTPRLAVPPPRWLRRHGTTVYARVLEVWYPKGRKFGTDNYYTVVMEGENPENGQPLRFESKPLYFDPTHMLPEEYYPVLVDLDNPSNYHINIAIFHERYEVEF